MAQSDPQCGAIPPNVGGPIPCHLDPGHDGQHFSTTGCAGSEIHWDTLTPLTVEELSEAPTIMLAAFIGETSAALDHIRAINLGDPEVEAYLITSLAHLTRAWMDRTNAGPAENVISLARIYCSERVDELAAYDQMSALVMEGFR